MKVVGVAGFEPAASWTRTKRDTKLRHTPIASVLYRKFRILSRGRFQKKTPVRLDRGFMERVTRLELATSTLARWRSTG